jgi:hypothetical protein
MANDTAALVNGRFAVFHRVGAPLACPVLKHLLRKNIGEAGLFARPRESF